MLHKNLADPDHLKKYTIASLKKSFRCRSSFVCKAGTLKVFAHVLQSVTYITVVQLLLEVRALLQKRDNSRATSSDIMYETKDSQHLNVT